MAIQMGVTIGLGVWAGVQLDKRYTPNHHAWTLSLSIVSVVISMYAVIKDLTKK